MREIYIHVLKKFFYERLMRSRYERCLTQAQMGRLVIIKVLARIFAYFSAFAFDVMSSGFSLNLSMYLLIKFRRLKPSERVGLRRSRILNCR